MNFLKDKIRTTLDQLWLYRRKQQVDLDGFFYKECPYKNLETKLPTLDDPELVEFKGRDWKIGADKHAWFVKHLVVPASLQGEKMLRLEIECNSGGWNVSNPQFIVYVNGHIRQGLDINHKSVVLGEMKECDLVIYAYTGDTPRDFKFIPRLFVYDEVAEKLYYDIRVPYELLDVLNPLTKDYTDIINHLDTACNMLDLRQSDKADHENTFKKAEEYMEKVFYGKYCKKRDTSVICFGHTHIDCAWQWTLQQSREKAQRSFSTVMRNMEEYPDFHFMQSQPLLYQYVKEESPELYEEIKARIAEGRWEAEGGMWVEADTNVPSGESLVRQFLYGKEFFRKEFGKESRLFWEPDVFGYSAQLPQIMRKSGVDYFITSKLSWNETNRHPYDIFKWRGIDGTDVNAYFITSQEGDWNGDFREYRNGTTYNAQVNSRFVVGTFNRCQQKGLTDTVLLPFGYGDGGGGPCRDDLENYKRLKYGLPSASTLKMGNCVDFLDDLFKKNENNPNMPVSEGELYFELHRGTYTGIAKNKRNNRKSEFLYQNIEQLATINQLLMGGKYPKEMVKEAWLTILTNQFHDIIPGSSIEEVYNNTDETYGKIMQEGSALYMQMLRELAAHVHTNEGGVLVYNPHSDVKSANVRVGDELVYVENLPQKGYALVKPIYRKGTNKISEYKMENKFFTLKFNKKYQLTSIYDKKNSREILKKGALGNRLVAYEDYPRCWDNWDVSEYYSEKYFDIDDVSSVEFIQDGVRDGIQVTRKYLNSTISQIVWLYENSPKVDFDTKADWHEHHIFVRALFDTDIHSQRATYNIQFGNIERPTTKNNSWEEAKFEVCAQKFADLSEGDYGVSLMNDCKYGHSIRDGVIGISLIKCGTSPNPNADIGKHEFVYSLFPHKGILTPETLAMSYELNNPVMGIEIGKQEKGVLPPMFSLASSNKDNVIIETVKKAEESEDTIYRVYEANNAKTPVTITFGLPIEEVTVCDLQENPIETLKVVDDKVKFTIKPYEIVTLKVKNTPNTLF